MAFDPGELSTVIGLRYLIHDPREVGKTLSLDIHDLPCGPINGTGVWLPEDAFAHTDYVPILALPSRLKAYRPAWRACKNDIFQGQDPPVALQKISQLLGVTSTEDPGARRSTPVAPIPNISELPSNTSQSSPVIVDPSGNTGIVGYQPVQTATPDPSNTVNHPHNISPGIDPTLVFNDDSSQNPEHSSQEAIGPHDPVAQPSSGTMSSVTGSNSPTAVIVQGQTITGDAILTTAGAVAIVYSSGSVQVGDQLQVAYTGDPSRQVDASVVVGGLTFAPIISPLAQVTLTHPASSREISCMGMYPVAGSPGAIIIAG